MPGPASSPPCAFCRRTGVALSKEHIWPDWIRDLLSEDVRNRPVTVVFEGTVRGRTVVERQAVFNQRVRSVCESCNNGWMGRREEAVKPILAKPLFGLPRAPLSEDEQASTAAWAVLKAFVGRLADRTEDPYGRIPGNDYRGLYETRDFSVSRSFTVYVGRTTWAEGGDVPAGFSRFNGIAFGDEKTGRQDGYALTFSVLSVVFHIVRVFDLFNTERAHRNHEPEIAPSLAQIWPVVAPLSWPPGPPLTRGGLALISGAAEPIDT